MFLLFAHSSNCCKPPILRVEVEWAVPEKNQAGGIEDMEFPGVIKTNHAEFPEVLVLGVRYFRVVYHNFVEFS